MFIKNTTMKSILSITLIASLLLFVNAEDDGAKCIKATRKSTLFPYGDERARSDFCVRMSDIISGFSDSGSLQDLCKVDDDKITQAVNATQNIVFYVVDGVVTANDTSAVDHAYSLFNASLNCDQARDMSITETKKAVETQLQNNNLVVKSSLLQESGAALLKFSKAVKEEGFVAGRVASELDKLKQEQSSAQSTINDANSALTSYFETLLDTVTNQMTILTERRTGTGKITSTDVSKVLASIRNEIEQVDGTLSSTENFAQAIKDSLQGDLDLSRQFELVKDRARREVSAERSQLMTDLEALMTNAWDNFEALTTDDATFDPNA